MTTIAKETYSYPFTFDQVWQMYADKAFTEMRLKMAGIQATEVQVDSSDTTITIRGTASVPTSEAPAALRRFLPSAVKVSVQEQWHKTSPSEANGTMLIETEGIKASISAKCALVGQGATTERLMDAQVKIGIPLVGSKIEKEAIKYVPRLVRAELEAADQYWKERK